MFPLAFSFTYLPDQIIICSSSSSPNRLGQILVYHQATDWWLFFSTLISPQLETYFENYKVFCSTSMQASKAVNGRSTEIRRYLKHQNRVISVSTSICSCDLLDLADFVSPTPSSDVNQQTLKVFTDGPSTSSTLHGSDLFVMDVVMELNRRRSALGLSAFLLSNVSSIFVTCLDHSFLHWLDARRTCWRNGQRFVDIWCRWYCGGYVARQTDSPLLWAVVSLW